MLLPRTEDDRVMFVLPWFGNTIVGTTDTEHFSGTLDRPYANDEDKKYLIRHVKKYFDLENVEYISSWSGVRALIDSKETNSKNISRGHFFKEIDDNFIQISGGKLTGFRIIAKESLENFYTFDFKLDKLKFVDEILGFEFSGIGEHLIVNIRKHGQNSRWIAARLAELSGIEERHVGYCGLKDRYAVTSQWYSLYLPNRCLNMADLSHPDFEVISLNRHRKKLRRGMHAGNSFNIVINNITTSQEKLEQRLETIDHLGFPNYFAERRFGFNGGNLVEAARLIDSSRLKGNRMRQGIFLSAARSWLFNLVLARHITNYHDGTIFPSIY